MINTALLQIVENCVLVLTSSELSSLIEKRATKFRFLHNYRHRLASVCGLKIIYNTLLVEEISEHAEELESGRLMVTVEPQ